MRVAGKTALVMGAGQTTGETIGNGRAIATLLAREGARVLCADRDLARAEETVAAIRAEGGQAEAIACDVTKRAECDAAVAAAGTLDILVNNVGIGGNDGPAHTVAEEAFDRILSVNLKGVLNGIAAAIPGMRERKSGAIVNISSLAGIAGYHMVA
jgi:NAD(P)-dependent dehydrogenase (short-subunit alcohol dehydrogenase family)